MGLAKLFDAGTRELKRCKKLNNSTIKEEKIYKQQQRI